jgi:CRP-like cAMP-binding protein
MVRLKETRFSLRRARWAKEVSDEALDRMLEHATAKSFARDSFILRHQDCDHGFFGVLSGQVRLSIPAETGDEFIFWDLRKGSWFGSTTLIDNSPTSYNARALVDSEIIEIPRSAVAKAAKMFPEIYKALFADQALYTRMMYKLITSILFYPLKSRLAFRLLVLIKMHGHRKGPSAYFKTSMSQSDFANLVNGSRQQVNRIFRQWDDDGLVKFVDGQYHVPSVKRLAVESKSTAS